MDRVAGRRSNEDTFPRPDPTTLTTEMGQRLETQFKGELAALKELLKAEMNGLRELHGEKFIGVQTQFRDSDKAVQAALQAAKEAVGEQNKSSDLAIAKSETATSKQIDQLGALLSTRASGFDVQIGDLKSRIALIEGQGSGKEKSGANVFQIIFAIIAILSLIITAVALMKK
jgi:hypothetical protein